MRQSTCFLARGTPISPMIYQRLTCLNQSTTLSFRGVASCCPARVDFWGLALCWSRRYGRLALRNGCNLMEHPFEDAVMERVERVPIKKPTKSSGIEDCGLPNQFAGTIRPVASSKTCV